MKENADVKLLLNIIFLLYFLFIIVYLENIINNLKNQNIRLHFEQMYVNIE